MKISKTSWIFLIVIIIIAAGTGLGMARSSQSDQQQQLTSQLNQARLRLSQLNTDDLKAKQAQVSQQIALLNSQFSRAENKLSANLESIGDTGTILEIANSLNIDINSLTSSGMSSDKLEGIECKTLSINLQVTGYTYNIRDFVLALSQRYPTSSVTSVQLNTGKQAAAPAQAATNNATAEATPAPVLIPDSTNDATAAINLVIYSYGGK